MLRWYVWYDGDGLTAMLRWYVWYDGDGGRRPGIRGLGPCCGPTQHIPSFLSVRRSNWASVAALHCQANDGGLLGPTITAHDSSLMTCVALIKDLRQKTIYIFSQPK